LSTVTIVREGYGFTPLHEKYDSEAAYFVVHAAQ
jgi:hypothetical protein